MASQKLQQTHKIEKEFHDSWSQTVNPETINFQSTFTAITAIENRYALKQFGNISQQKILDLGCGIGDATLYFAQQGAHVDAIDISPGMIKLVNKLAKKHRLSSQINAQVMPAEKLVFKDNHFDIIFGNGVLHHVSIQDALKEVHRVLKPNGIAAFIEPLAHNPLINIYRRIAYQVRTPTETPLNYQQLAKMNKLNFTHFSHQEFHLTTLSIFLWFYLIEKTNPNQERYWKKIIDESERIKTPFQILNSLDKHILNFIPYLKPYCWNTVLIFKK